METDKQKKINLLLEKYDVKDEVIKGMAKSFVYSTRLRFVRRYSTQPLVHEQTVMDHTGSVSIIGALFIILDAHELSIEQKYIFLVKLIFHDLHELVTGDIIWPMKRHNERSESVYNEAAESGMKKLMGFLYKINEFNRGGQDELMDIFTGKCSYKGDDITDKLVEFFDRMEIFLYIREEERLNNYHLRNIGNRVIEMCLDGIFTDENLREHSRLIERLRQLFVEVRKWSWQNEALDLEELDGSEI